MSNLPKWAGADTVYTRAGRIASALNLDSYRAQRAASKRKRFRFSPPPEAIAIIEAMNRGDEESLKAFTFQYRHLY